MSKGKLVTRKFSELVFDYRLYPRSQVDSVHVTDLIRLSESGVEFAPIVICEQSNRVVDGFHRSHCYERRWGANVEIECLAKRYADDQALFREAVRYADNVLKKFTAFDRAHCLVVAEQLGIDPEQIAKDLRMTMDEVGELKADRVGEIRVGNRKESVPLKRTIRHMAGRTLTKEQTTANERISGMNQSFYVNQLITLIETDLIDKEDEKLFERLKKLYTLLDDLLVAN